MAPNHGWDPVGSLFGPMGSDWVQNMGQNRKKNYHAPKCEFSTSPRSSNFAKNGSYGYGAKSRWGSRGVYLGANGVPLGPKKWVKTVQNYHAPKFKFSTTPRSSIFPKKGSYGYGTKSRWGLPRVHHGANGSHGAKKWVKTIKNYHAPKFAFSTTPRSSIFCKKWKLRLWRQITVGTP